MIKDPALLELLERIEGEIGPDSYEIVDHWSGDLVATGLAKPGEPGRLAYISVGIDQQDRYYVECELPTEDEALGYRVETVREGCDFPELILVIKKHLCIDSR